MVVLGQKWFYLGKLVLFFKMVVFGPNLFYLGKMVVFGEKLFHLGKMFEFGQKWFYLGNWLYLGKSDSVWAKIFVFGKSGFI